MSIYADNLDTYWAAGWRGILPLPHGKKKHPPPGYTGETGQTPSYPDCRTWADTGTYTATTPDGRTYTTSVGNIALRLPPDTIGLDIDAYGDKPGAATLQQLETAHSPLPATWRTSSRDDPTSGIRLYRIPEGLHWPNQAGPGIEIIRHGHRYAVAPPSTHPDTRQPYRWTTPDGVTATTPPRPEDLPLLPQQWVQALTGGRVANPDTPRQHHNHDQAMLWLAELPHTTDRPCPTMQAAADRGGHDIASGGSAYDALIPNLLRIVRYGGGHHHGCITALGQLKHHYLTEVTNWRRAAAGRTVRTQTEAEGEYLRALIGAVNIVAADPGPPVCDCFGQITEQIIGPGDTGNTERQYASDHGDMLHPGGSFILDAPEHPPALWGDDDTILWAEGEALMIVGTPGAGKTTLTGQLLRGLLNIDHELLGLPVKPAGRILYLAMDRPEQIRRALARMFTEHHRATLDRRLAVWKGPPPADMAKNTQTLLALARLAEADTIIIDSLKDAAIGLSDDETGAGYNRTRQTALANGVQVLELHHQTKRNAAGGKPKGLEDVYGSAWLTAGAGSVLLLHADEAGSPVVAAIHLKQPAQPFGPHTLIHDHTLGVTRIAEDDTDPVAVAEQAHQPGGITIAGILGVLAERSPEWREKMTRNEASAKENIRVRLKRAAARGRVRVIREGVRGGLEAAYGPAQTNQTPNQTPNQTVDQTPPNNHADNPRSEHGTPPNTPPNKPNNRPNIATPPVRGGDGDMSAPNTGTGTAP